jgi:hypothetical protein
MVDFDAKKKPPFSEPGRLSFDSGYPIGSRVYILQTGYGFYG